MVWWLVLGYFPTAAGAALAVAALRSGHDYGYRGRHHSGGRRRTSPSTFRLADLPHHVTGELSEARARVNATAERIEERARVWSSELAESWLGIIEHEPAPELHAFEHGAGSAAYLDVTSGALALPPREVDRSARDARVTTQEMTLEFGERLGPILGPIEPDEWTLPDEAGEDPGIGRHARGREKVST